MLRDIEADPFLYFVDPEADITTFSRVASIQVMPKEKTDDHEHPDQLPAQQRGAAGPRGRWRRRD